MWSEIHITLIHRLAVETKKPDLSSFYCNFVQTTLNVFNRGTNYNLYFIKIFILWTL